MKHPSQFREPEKCKMLGKQSIYSKGITHYLYQITAGMTLDVFADVPALQPFREEDRFTVLEQCESYKLVDVLMMELSPNPDLIRFALKG